MRQPSLPGEPGATTQVDVTGHEDLLQWTARVAASQTHLRAVVLLVDGLADDVRNDLRRPPREIASASPPRVFVFRPTVKHCDWWVLLPEVGQQAFESEEAAVDFALVRARELSGSGCVVEVVQEQITGTWTRLAS